MKIWFPTVKANSGADVFVERLVDGLNASGHEAVISWFWHYHELFPFFMGAVRAPTGTDIIHTNSWQTLAFSRPPIPLVMTYHHCVHDEMYKSFVSSFQDIYHKSLIFFYEKRGFKKADAIVFPSEYTSNTAGKFFGNDSQQVIYPAVDSSVFRPADKNLVSEKFKLLYVGNTSSRKGFDMLAKIMGKLDDTIELYYSTGMRGGDLFVAGKAQQIRLKTLEELVLAYQNCDAVIYPTRYEGFGYVACEAMACGKPIIASRCTSIPEIVIDGITGKLCEPDDVEAFVEVVKLFSKNRALCLEMGERGRERVMEKFCIDRMVREYVDLYESLCASY